MTSIVEHAQARQARQALQARSVGPCHLSWEASMVALSETRSDRQEVVPMMNGYAMSGWGWLLMTLGTLGFWALVAVLALALLRRPGPPDQQPPTDQQPRPGAEEILAERLAPAGAPPPGKPP